MGCCTVFSRLLLGIANIIVFIASLAAIVALAVLPRYTPEHLIYLCNSTLTISINALLIVTAIATLFLSILGLVATYKRSRLLLRIFATIIIVMVLIDTSLAVVSYNFGDDRIGKRLLRVLDETFDKAINQNDDISLSIVNSIQSNFECCGFNDPSDWPVNLIPTSCSIPSEPGNIYINGCGRIVFHSAKKVARHIGNSLVAVIMIEVLLVITALCISTDRKVQMQRFWVEN
ncbi:hypothetical protein ACOME3_005162 [Neoechinorhynchus agilis]